MKSWEALENRFPKSAFASKLADRNQNDTIHPSSSIVRLVTVNYAYTVSRRVRWRFEQRNIESLTRVNGTSY
jgi:hypothetical protein